MSKSPDFVCPLIATHRVDNSAMLQKVLSQRSHSFQVNRQGVISRGTLAIRWADYLMTEVNLIDTGVYNKFHDIITTISRGRIN